MTLKLIAALGNNEEKYRKTRHNIGFEWLDRLAKKYDASWQQSSHGKGTVTKLTPEHHDSITLFKPGLLMNINGRPIADYARYFRIEPSQILLVYDDLDLQTGIIKCRRSAGHGGHNGVRDLGSHLDISQVLRLKIGIGRPTNKNMTSQYVLQDPNEQEYARINQAIESSIAHSNLILSQNINAYCEQLAIINQQEKSDGI